MSHLCRLPLEGVSAKWLNFSPIIAHNPPHNFQPFCPNPRKPGCKYILRKAACYFHSFRSTIAPICLYSWTSTSEATNLIPGPLHWGNIPWLHLVKTFCPTAAVAAVAFGIPLNPTFNICKFMQTAPQGQMLLQYR